jgi:hypothetical protein
MAMAVMTSLLERPTLEGKLFLFWFVQSSRRLSDRFSLLCSYAEIAPNAKADISFQGAAYVFLASSFPKTIAAGSARMNASSAADFVLQQSESYQWFGKSVSVLAPTEENGLPRPLLLVGAPSFHAESAGDENSAVGRLYAYSISGAAVQVEWTLTGTHHAGRLGQAVAAAGDIIAVSEPAFNATKARSWDDALSPSVSLAEELGSMRNGEVLRAGRVLLYSVRSLSDAVACSGPSLSTNNLAFTEVTGHSFEGRFGSSLSFGAKLRNNMAFLAVGEPLADYGAGAAHIFGVSTDGGYIGVEHSRTVRGLIAFGRRSKARLGSSALIAGGKLFVGAPYSTMGAEDKEAKSLEEVGTVLVADW